VAYPFSIIKKAIEKLEKLPRTGNTTAQGRSVFRGVGVAIALPPQHLSYLEELTGPGPLHFSLIARTVTIRSTSSLTQ
jgi:hypothetical protein